MMNVQKVESIGDFIKNALKDSSHTVIPNISAAKGIWHVVLSPNMMSYDCKRIVWPYAVQVDEELYLYLYYQIVDSKGKWKLVVTSINLKI